MINKSNIPPTKNIVHLADSAKNEYISNELNWLKNENEAFQNAKRTIFKPLPPRQMKQLVKHIQVK